jgi:CSLREA domain-containing protein
MSIAAVLAFAGVVALLGIVPGRHAAAAAIVVTKTADTNDGTCDADCSLREAVVAANALAGHDNIAIPAGTYTLTGATGEDASASGDLDVTDSVSFNGAGMGTTTINGGGLESVIQVLDSAAQLILTDITVTNGGGDGISANAADISLVNASVSANGDEGILTFSGNVDLQASVIDSNGDEGIITNTGNVTLSTSTVSRNDADGILTFSGNVDATNSTISNNDEDGILTNSGDVTLNFVTVAGNSGIGIEVATGLIDLTGTIVANNDSGDCSTDVESDSHSLDSDGSCGLGGTSISSGVANLGNLQNNGGTTETHDLLAGSDAIDAGGTSCPEDDQRGANRFAGAACDIGAVESQGAVGPTATATATATPCDEVCPTATATSVTLKTHTPTATGTAQATSTPVLAETTETPRPAVTATPQGGQGGVVRGPDTGSGGGSGHGGSGLWGVIALAVAGSIASGVALRRRCV